MPRSDVKSGRGRDGERANGGDGQPGRRRGAGSKRATSDAPAPSLPRSPDRNDPAAPAGLLAGIQPTGQGSGAAARSGRAGASIGASPGAGGRQPSAPPRRGTPRRPELRLGRVESRALHQRVADQLRAAIVSGDVAPGTWLREVDVAERVGVSRAPVREALRALERDGLIVSYPYRGVQVLGVDVAEAIELFTPLRQTIESYAARRLIERALGDRGGRETADPNAPRDAPVSSAPAGAMPGATADVHASGADRLAAVADAMAGTIEALRRAGAAGDAAGVAEADVVFHRTLCCESGLPLVAQLWRLIEPRVERIFQARYAVSDPLDPAYLDQLASTHARVVAALRAHDAAAASDVLRAHIATGMSNASAALRSR